MKKRLFIYVFLLLILAPILSLEWPGEEQNFYILFGQKNEVSKSFSRGVIFKNATTVRASEHGDHLITIEQKNSNFPSTLGNAVIFIHDDGLQTIYANLKDSNLFSTRTDTETGSIIGQTGHSAWSENEALIFQVVDTKKRVFINPLLLLPALNDEVKPTIDNVILTNSNNRKISLDKVKVIKQGKYKLYADVYDRLSKEKGMNNILAPFRVTVLINGINVISVPFEVLKTENRVCMLEGTKINAENLYETERSMHFGELNLTSGKIDLTINARDISGNERTKSYSFIVK